MPDQKITAQIILYFGQKMSGNFYFNDPDPFLVWGTSFTVYEILLSVNSEQRYNFFFL